MKRITYFSGAHAGKHPDYIAAAEQIGDFVGRQSCHAKYGGSRTGLMGAFCFSFLKAAKESQSMATIEGILPNKYATVNKPETLGIPYTLTETLAERKALLLEGSDAFLVMPGGIGTMDEIFETIETDYLPADRDPSIGNYTIRPIFILNLHGFYNATKAQLLTMTQNGFLVSDKTKNLFFIDTVEDYLKQLKEFFGSE